MATVGPTNIPAFFNTDADFRTWGSTISAALATLGLVNTADTGQINWTTVVKPAGTSTQSGYEIWRFADSLQGTTPVYLKLTYGSAAAADRPSLWIQVGSGSNGTGTLTGQTNTQVQSAGSVSKTAGVTLPFWACGNSGELLLAVNVDTGGTNTVGFFLSVERPKDSNDTTTADGVYSTWMSQNVGVTSQFVPASGTVPGSSTGGGSGLPAVHPNVWSRSASGGNVDVCPVFVPIGGVWRYSHVNIHKAGDLAAAGSYTTTILGGSHTYMSMDAAVTGTGAVAGGSSGAMSFRWE